MSFPFAGVQRPSDGGAEFGVHRNGARHPAAAQGESQPAAGGFPKLPKEHREGKLWK